MRHTDRLADVFRRQPACQDHWRGQTARQLRPIEALAAAALLARDIAIEQEASGLGMRRDDGAPVSTRAHRYCFQIWKSVAYTIRRLFPAVELQKVRPDRGDGLGYERRLIIHEQRDDGDERRQRAADITRVGD